MRVKDLDFDRGLIMGRLGKGDKDRSTLLPDPLHAELRAHLQHVQRLHDGDLAQGYGEVLLPPALARKYPSASREFRWQYVFPVFLQERGINLSTFNDG